MQSHDEPLTPPNERALCRDRRRQYLEMGGNDQGPVGSKRLHKAQMSYRVPSAASSEKNASNRRFGLQERDVKGVIAICY
jgi:hypothetical protein